MYWQKFYFMPSWFHFSMFRATHWLSCQHWLMRVISLVQKMCYYSSRQPIKNNSAVGTTNSVVHISQSRITILVYMVLTCSIVWFKKFILYFIYKNWYVCDYKVVVTVKTKICRTRNSDMSFIKSSIKGFLQIYNWI